MAAKNGRNSTARAASAPSVRVGAIRLRVPGAEAGVGHELARALPQLLADRLGHVRQGEFAELRVRVSVERTDLATMGPAIADALAQLMKGR